MPLAAQVAHLEPALFPRQLGVQRRQEGVIAERDVAVHPADAGGRLFTFETLNLDPCLGEQHEGQALIAAAIGGEAAQDGGVEGGAADRAGVAFGDRGSQDTRAGDTGPGGCSRDRRLGGGGLGQRLAAIGAELRAGLVLPAAEGAGAHARRCSTGGIN